MIGTVGYLAPEQARGEVADHRADVFSLGAVLFEMLTGHRAFKGTSPAELLSSVLSDSRRLLVAQHDRIVLLDTRTGRASPVLPVAAQGISVSRGDRWVTCIEPHSEADVWMATIEP